MSRHGYVDEGELDWLQFGRWQGAVRSAIRGKRGQAFLREMIEALDTMPEKKLYPSVLIGDDGETCAMGCVLAKRGTDTTGVDPEEPDDVAKVTGLASAMVREIAYENDESGAYQETSEARWARMRHWAESKLKKVGG